MGSVPPDDTEVGKPSSQLFVGRPFMEKRARPAFGKLSLGTLPEARQVSRSPRGTPSPHSSRQDGSFDGEHLRQLSDASHSGRQLSGEGFDRISSHTSGRLRISTNTTFSNRDSSAVRFTMPPQRGRLGSLLLPAHGWEGLRPRTQTMCIAEDEEEEPSSLAEKVAASMRPLPRHERMQSSSVRSSVDVRGEPRSPLRGSVNAADASPEQPRFPLGGLAACWDRILSAGRRMGTAVGEGSAVYLTLREEKPEGDVTPRGEDNRCRAQSEVSNLSDGLLDETTSPGDWASSTAADFRFRRRRASSTGSEACSQADQEGWMSGGWEPATGDGKRPTRWAQGRRSGLLDAFDVSEKSCLRRIISWQGIVCAMIVMNTFIIALEAVFISRRDMRPFFEVVEGLFTCFYVFEVANRIKMEGPRRFLYGEDWNWNIFDSFVTLLGLVDMMMPLYTGDHKHNGTNVGRVFRVLRILRLFRAGRFLSDVDYVLTMAFSATLKLVAVVTLVLLVFAIIATNLLWDAEEAESAEMFQDLAASMWTLFRIMTLDDWVDMVGPIISQEPDTKLFFVVFIFFGAIALMSLVPTIFIQLKMDQDGRRRKETEEKKERKKQLRDHDTLDALFTFIDSRAEGCGIVSSSVATGMDPDTHELIQVARERKLSYEQMREMVLDVQLGVFRFVADHNRTVGEDGEEVEMDEDDFHNILRARDTVDMKRVWHASIETRRDLHSKFAEMLVEIRALKSDAKAPRPSDAEIILSEIRALKADVEAGKEVKQLEVLVAIEASRAELAGLREGLAAWQASVEALQTQRVAAEASAEALRDAAGPELLERQAFRREIHALRQELAALRPPQFAGDGATGSAGELAGLRCQALGAEASRSQPPLGRQPASERLPGLPQRPQPPPARATSLSPPKVSAGVQRGSSPCAGAAVLERPPSRPSAVGSAASKDPPGRDADDALAAVLPAPPAAAPRLLAAPADEPVPALGPEDLLCSPGGAPRELAQPPAARAES